MKMQIVCLRDIKTDAHTTPQFVTHIESWRRALGDAINQPTQETMQFDFVKHPEDFEAYHLGSWESDTAEFTGMGEKGTAEEGKPNYARLLEVNDKYRLFLLAELVKPKQ